MSLTNSPYFIYAKVGALIALVLGSLWVGHHFGAASGEIRATKAEAELSELKATHAEEMTILQGKSMELVTAKVAENSARFKVETTKLKEANAAYQKQLKEMEAARSSALRIAVVPDGGMWMDVDAQTCTGPSGSYGDGNATEGEVTYDLRGPTTRRCRLSRSSAEFLVALASEADQIAGQFNLCRSEIRVVNAQDPVSKP